MGYGDICLIPSVAMLAPKNNHSVKNTCIEETELRLSYRHMYVHDHMGCMALSR